MSQSFHRVFTHETLRNRLQGVRQEEEELGTGIHPMGGRHILDAARNPLRVSSGHAVSVRR